MSSSFIKVTDQEGNLGIVNSDFITSIEDTGEYREISFASYCAGITVVDSLSDLWSVIAKTKPKPRETKRVSKHPGPSIF